MSKYKFKCHVAEKYENTLQIDLSGSLYTVKKYAFATVENYPYLYLTLDSFYTKEIIISFTPTVSEHTAIILEQIEYCVKTKKNLVIRTEGASTYLFMDIKGTECKYTIGMAVV